ncbi:late endosomal/lysosomal adaptor, MAPK and MTOR activator 2 [Dermatophagoides farinae]|uniref:Ragulator complex protein LAMTOR2 homolog n=1 Tax=Dermatophagoides farinae TaxID=6954 RepID=A0A922L3S4_DERFA|nr:ragulator complex protein LAMTOR2 homolog [Dermatophagoides farinae]KAH7637543.1 ragulator complex protein lamtor2-like protein [Dermatophagoides farinae]KAH9501978.1 Ragulator complex protein lamtor2 [Dermatophagoides farinae]
MLRPKTLTQILNQANTAGISATLLFNKDGRLLAYSGYGDKDVRMIAAIASGIWASYSNYGRNHLASSQLSYVYIEAEHGIALIAAVADVLLCLYSRDSPVNVDIGTLKQKMKALADHLEAPLSQLSGI